MTLLRAFLEGLKALYRKDQRNRDLDEELRNYLEAAAQDKMHGGMSHAEALRAARVHMGSTEAVKQEVRSSGWESALDSVSQDVRYGVRQLFRSPAFSIVAVLTLALGIGANTAIFTLVHAVMMKQLPVADPQQLYRIGAGEQFCCEWGGLQDSWGTFDYAFYTHLRDTNTGFSQIAAFSGNTPSFSVRRGGSSEVARTVNSEYVSGNYFTMLGLQPNAGRLLSIVDDRPEATAVAVMGHRLWQQRYGSDQTISGSVLLVNGLPVTVIGIAPPGFSGARLTTDAPELWIPLNQEPAFEGQGRNAILYSPGMAWLYVIGRLNPGTAPAQVESHLSGELRQWLRASGRFGAGNEDRIQRQHIQVTSGSTGISSFRSNSRTGLYLLSGISALVLLIACANLANLLLTRSASRRHQTSLRLSLGATRARLMRAMLTESVILSLLGGAAGLFVAFAGTKGILLLVFRGVQYVPIDAAPSWPVFLFALLLSALTGILFGVVPAWITARADPSEGLRSGNRSTADHSSGSQAALVVVQAALSIVLLAVAGLVTQSLRNLETADLGFQPQGMLMADLSIKAAGYQPAQLPALYEQLEDRLERIPGVRSASFSLNSPQNLCCLNMNVSLGGRSEPWIGNVNVVFVRVSPRYFETIGTPLLRGRTFSERDTPTSRRVAVVDQAFARKFFPNMDPLGKLFGLSLPGHGNDYEIVGVVKDAKYRNPAAEQNPMYFLPFNQTIQYEPSGYRRLETGTQYAQSIQIRVAGIPEHFEDKFRSALAGINPNLSVVSMRSYSEQIAVQFNQERLIARLTALFSLLSLVLASVGLYGVTAYNVTRRTSEIGIRMALGADRRSVVRMVLGSALSQVGIGLCLGIPMAMLCGRYLAHQLYGVSRFDPFALGGAAIVLCACAFVAGLLPACRAASIEPVTALRAE